MRIKYGTLFAAAIAVAVSASAETIFEARGLVTDKTPEDGDYEFGHINDYFGELHVNGVFVRETQGPGRSWKTISIPLKKGKNDVLFKTRSGAYGSWPVGFEIPDGVSEVEDGKHVECGDRPLSTW